MGCSPGERQPRRDPVLPASPRPHQELHPGPATGRLGLPGRRPRGLPPHDRRHRPRHLRCGRSTSPPARNAWSPTPPRCTSAGDEDLPPEERARRERMPRDRRAASSATPPTGRRARRRSRSPGGCTSSTSRVDGGAAADRHARRRHRPAAGPARSARRLRQRRGALHVLERGHGRARSPHRRPRRVTYGLADFVAAEEMERAARLLVVARGRRARSSRASTTSPVQRWHIADPAHPDAAGRRSRLPGGGHAERDVTAGSSTGRRAASTPWDRDALPYLADVVWRRRARLRRRPAPRPAAPAGAARRPGHRGDDGRRTRTHDPTGSTSCPASRACSPTAGW